MPEYKDYQEAKRCASRCVSFFSGAPIRETFKPQEPKSETSKVKHSQMYDREHVKKLMQLSYMSGYEGTIDLMDEEIEDILSLEPPKNQKTKYDDGVVEMVNSVLNREKPGLIFSPDGQHHLEYSVSEGKWKNPVTHQFYDNEELLDYNLKYYSVLIHG